MKKALSVLLVVCLLFTLSACGSAASESSVSATPEASSEAVPPESTAAPTPTAEPSTEAEPTPEPETSKTLVVYFSCTGHTKAAAEKMAELTGADLYEITPEEPYTSDDLNYNDDNCRANQEMNDDTARPAIAGDMLDFSKYDTVLVGFPIWWGTMPRIMNTFFDTYDLTGKTVLPFCTSGSSGISTAVSAIREVEPNADVRDGLRVSNPEDSAVTDWLSENGFAAGDSIVTE